MTSSYSFSRTLFILPCVSHSFLSSGLKSIDTLLTQCRSSLGLPKRSPLKICPRWPPQLLHTISVRIIPRPGSGRWPQHLEKHPKRQASRTQNQTCGLLCTAAHCSRCMCRHRRRGSACRTCQSREARCPSCGGCGIALCTQELAT